MWLNNANATTWLGCLDPLPREDLLFPAMVAMEVILVEGVLQG